MRLPVDTENYELGTQSSNEHCGARQVCTDAGVQIQKLLVTVEDASEILGIGRTGTYELVMRGEIASVKIGRRRLVVKSALAEYVEQLLKSQRLAT